MIYDAKIRLTEAMQQMATAATCDSLPEAIKTHLQEKKNRLASLQGLFESQECEILAQNQRSDDCPSV